MQINQAFTILQTAGGIRAARIITENVKNLGRFRVWRMVRQIRRGVPVAKIIHQKWFYGLKFYTNKYTLDPRPDTETLVAAVISDCGANCQSPRILDLGTGTGCIIAALVKNIAGAIGIGIDRSWRAVRVARKNIRDLGLCDRVQIRRARFDNFRVPAPQKFDIIVSNPPYITRGDPRVNDGAMHDPKMALYASENGLAAYRVIACHARNWLRAGGKIYLEIGDGQDASVREIFECAGWEFVRMACDLGGVKRVLVFR